MRQAKAGHLTREQRDRIAAGEMPSRAELRELIGHLVGGCSTCRALVASLLRPSTLPAPEERYELPVARVLAAAKAGARGMEEYRRLARLQLEKALGAAVEGSAPREALRPPLESSPAERWAWGEALVEMARDGRGDPLAMLELAEQAVELSEELARGPYPRPALANLQAKARMEYGNRLRVVEDLPGAERELTEAIRRWEKGTGAPRIVARLFDLHGSLSRARRRISEALKVLDLAARLYRHHGELHWAGRVLVKQGATLIVAGRPEEALVVLEDALQLLDREREPVLQLRAEHNLLLALIEVGRTEEAAQRLWAARPLYESLGDALDQIKLTGLEAMIAAAQGQPRRAEKLFRDEKAGYESLGHRYPAAIACLDLAAVLLEQHRPTEVPGLLHQALDTFCRLGIERETLVALSLLHVAAKQRKATATLVREIVRKLRHREVRERREPL